MNKISCGIDFGTSNSSVAVASNGVITPVPMADGSVTIPSAIFFPKFDSKPVYGKIAMQRFLQREEGRLMRSLKRVLGTTLMKQGTMVNGKVLKFDYIISAFIKNLKATTETFYGTEIENVVMGRPVHFVDNDPSADQRATDELRSIAGKIGFKHIDFQFEPIAAAFAHETRIEGEKLALVVDLGGGTADFTVIRLSKKYITKNNRTEDILANTGVRVGGNDFDKQLSLAAIMPELGYLSTYGAKKLEVPMKYFHDLAEWSKVNLLYTTKTLSHTRQLLHESHDRKRFGRLLKILEQESGHSLLAAAEDTKIALTAEDVHPADFGFLEQHFTILVSRSQFEESIQEELKKIVDSAKECLTKARVTENQVDLIILTGGSTEVPLVKATFLKMFPNAALAEENKLSSVGLGLAYDSDRKFR